MNCEHCEKKLSELYYTDNVYMTKVNECGQTVDAGKKELYFCNYECACKRHEHYTVKEKMKIIKKSKENVEDLEEIYKAMIVIAYCVSRIIIKYTLSAILFPTSIASCAKILNFSSVIFPLRKFMIAL